MSEKGGGGNPLVETLFCSVSKQKKMQNNLNHTNVYFVAKVLGIGEYYYSFEPEKRMFGRYSYVRNKFILLFIHVSMGGCILRDLSVHLQTMIVWFGL